MKKMAAIAVVGLIVVSLPSAASAHTPFKKELQEQYQLKTVSCYTCHSRKADVPEAEWEKAESTKQFRNAFGDAIHKGMASGNWSKRIDEAREQGDPIKDKVEAEAVEAFKVALKRAAQMKAASGKTYHEELTAGTLDGVKK